MATSRSKSPRRCQSVEVMMRVLMGRLRRELGCDHQTLLDILLLLLQGYGRRPQRAFHQCRWMIRCYHHRLLHRVLQRHLVLARAVIDGKCGRWEASPTIVQTFHGQRG